MKKKVLLFAVLMIATTFSPKAAAQTQNYDFSAVAPSGQTLYYQISGTTATLTSPGVITWAVDQAWDGYQKPTGDVVIPDTVVNNGISYPVTSIFSYAILRAYDVTSVVIPNTVRYISGSAFYGCSGLTSVSIPSSVTSLGSNPFMDCRNLTSITVDSNNLYYDSRNNCNAIILTSSNELVTGCQSTVIPSTVTSIGYGAFAGCNNLTQITIPNSVTSIGYRAFYSTGLTSITIPNSVTYIGDEAFSFCHQLGGNITIPEGVTSIGSSTFYWCGRLTSISLPSTLTSIGSSAFYECSRLSGTLIIPQSVTSIGRSAFAGCGGFTSIIVESGNSAYDSRNNCNAIINSTTNELILGCKNTIIPNSVRSIGNGAFSYCRGLTSINLPNGIDSIGYDAFYYCDSLMAITLPNSVITINARAFEYCKLTSIVIPNSVRIIGSAVFDGCSRLTSVTIGNSVETIGTGAFARCYNLKTIESLALVPPAFIVNGVIYADGDSTMDIASSVFQSIDLTRCGLYVPCGLESTYRTAYGWRNFSNIYGSYASISQVCNTGQQLRYRLNCDSTCTVVGYDNTCNGQLTIPDSVSYNGLTYRVTSIAHDAFNGCSGLTSVTIPNSVTSIGNTAFYNCSRLREITCLATAAPTLDNSVFGNVSSSIPIYVPCGSLSSYSTNWTYFSNFNETLGLTLNAQSADTMMGTVAVTTQPSCSDSTAVVTATANSGYRFDHWNDGDTTNPRTITVTQDMTLTAYFVGDSTQPVAVGDTVIVNCLRYRVISTSATRTVEVVGYESCLPANLTIPNSVTIGSDTYSVISIGNYAFHNCRGLTSLTIPNSVTSIGSQAFERCSGLTSVTIPNSVTTIGTWAFNNCIGLTSVTIPSSVISLGANPFMGCRNLTSITVAAENTHYDSRNNCNAIIRTASNTLISGCQNTAIPSSVTGIGECAFGSNSNLTSVTIPNSVTRIDGYAFDGCSGLTTVTIPNSVTHIGLLAFRSCRGLAEITCLATVAPTLEDVLGTYVFTNVSSSIPVYVPCGSLSSYSTNWTYFSNFNETLGLTLNAQSADTTMGTVAVTTQPSCSDSTAVVTATANSGYRFDHWNDGNTTNPLTITVTQDTSLTAYFTFACGDTVTVHDTAFIYIHDTTVMNDTVTLTQIVHDTTLVTDTVTLTQYVTVHDTTTITDTVTLTQYVTVHDTTTVTDTVTLTNTIYDTTYVNVPYAVHDTSYITLTDTVTNIVHDTTTVTDTLLVATLDTVYLPIYMPGTHDTLYLPMYVHDTTFVNVMVHDTTTMTDTLRLVTRDTIYLPVYVHDTTMLHDTTLLHDTTYVNRYVSDTVFRWRTDTVFVNRYIHDTTYVNLHHYDTIYLTRNYHDTTYVTRYIHDTTFINNYVHDTTYLTRYDTITITIHDTVPIGELNYYRLSVRSGNDLMGVGAGSGYFPVNTTVEIAAVPQYGFTFLRWLDGNTENPRRVVVESRDAIYTALFAVTNLSGIDGNEDAWGYDVATSRDIITVRGAEGHNIKVYDMSGRVLASQRDAAEVQSFRVPATGTYLVQVDGLPAKKVVVIK